MVAKPSDVEGRGATLLRLLADRLYGKMELALFWRLFVVVDDVLIDNSSSGIGYKIDVCE
jgi:hypothetical protein